MRAGTLTSLAWGHVVGKDLEWGSPKFQSTFNDLLIQPLAPLPPLSSPRVTTAGPHTT